MKHNFTKVLLTLTVGALSNFLLLPAKAQMTLVADGKSTFTIVVRADAPSSVQEAAQELQRDIELSTGVELSFQKDGKSVAPPILSLGDTEAAKAADISSEDMDDDSYRIITQDGNLYILGVDTPEGEWTEGSGISNGTANGVYTFLEDYLGVRWLMPGDLGLDIPAKSTFSIGDINRTETPLFNYRRIRYLDDYADGQQRAAIEDWMAHHRVGNQAAPVSFSATHNWWKTINRSAGLPATAGINRNSIDSAAVKEIYLKHPEWFAMDEDGKRPFPHGKYSKLETTNPELVKWFAEQAIIQLKSQTRPSPYSLSPSDGQKWSESPESKALYDPSPPNVNDPETISGKPGTSSLVLKWYHDVAQIVAKEYPQGKLSGFIYSSFLYPPTKFKMRLPDNFTPQIAFSPSYGYGLYRPETQELFKNVMSEWVKVAPKNWYYYDLPNLIIRQDRHRVGEANFHGATANVQPPAADILDAIFPTLVTSRIKGTLLYGSPSWSSSALTNYLLAKLEWNPQLKASEVKREWLRRAYGPDAGKVMELFYEELNNRFRAYYQRHSIGYELTGEILENIYAAHYPGFEKLFLQAKAQPMTKKQQQRLQLIEDNLITLQWRLRNGGYLSSEFISPLQRSDLQINHLITEKNEDFPLFPGALSSNVNPPVKPKALPWKVLFSNKVQPNGENTAPKWNDNQLLLYAATDGDIHITTEVVTHGIYFAAYEITDEKGKLITSGIFNTESSIAFPAKAGEAYMLTIPQRKPVNFQLQVKDAALATGDLQEKVLTLSSHESAPVYIFYASGQAPMGAFDDEGGARIRKPYSGYIAEGYIKSKYDKAQTYPLDNDWKFVPDPQNDGLKRGVTTADFDDSSWASISPLNWWQVQGLGFHDYHGPAWYRVKFQGKPLKDDETAILFFGAIDGNAEIYLNGKKVKEHILGPNFEGWNEAFTAKITNRMQPGENVLAVKVTSKDNASASGIFKGVALIVGKRK